MSHSKAVEYCRFYSSTCRAVGNIEYSSSATPRVDVISSFSGPLAPRHICKPGDFGYIAILQGTEHAPKLETTHHLRWDKVVGIAAAGKQRAHTVQQQMSFSQIQPQQRQHFPCIKK